MAFFTKIKHFLQKLNNVKMYEFAVSFHSYAKAFKMIES